MKVIYVFIAMALGLIVGGPAYIHFTGYDAFSPNFWITSIEVMITEPGTIAKAAFGGQENAELFQGIVMVGVGLMTLFLVLSSVLILPVFKKKSISNQNIISIKEKKKEKKRGKNIEDVKPFERNENLDFADETDEKRGLKRDESLDSVFDENEREKSSTLSKIKLRMKKNKEERKLSKSTDNIDRKNFVDEDVRLDDEDFSKGKRKFNFSLNDVFGKIKIKKKESKPKEFEDEKTWKRAVKDVSGNDFMVEEIDVDEGNRTGKKAGFKIDVIVGKRGEKEEKGKEENVFKKLFSAFKKKSIGKDEGFEKENKNRDVDEKKSDSILTQSIVSWYNDVREGIRSKSILVQEAKEILEKISDDERREIRNNDELDGDFVLRLIESWSVLKDFEDVEDEDDEKAALRRGIRAIKRSKNILEDEDESGVPDDYKNEIELEDIEPISDDVEDDIGFDNIGKTASGDERFFNSDSSDNVKKEGELSRNDVSGDEQIIEKIGRVAKEMKWLVNMAFLVRNGEDEWPEHLNNEDFRMEEVARLDEEMGQLVFFFDDDKMMAILEKQDSEEYQWLLENFSIIKDGFESFSRNLMNDENGDEDSDDNNDDDGISDEGIQNEEISDSNTVLVDNKDESSDTNEDANENSSMQDFVEDEMSNLDRKEEIIEQKDKDTENDFDEIKEPENINKPDMEEMSLASKEVMDWGVLAKKAGASAGTMMRFLFERGDEKILPIGSVHLVAMWKEKDKRMNVILRYLDVGKWFYDKEKPGFFQRENGDFVDVSEALFNHQEMKDSLVIIHAHGPGSQSLEISEPVCWKDNIWLVTSVIDEEKIKEIVGI